jgi:hypothetical protein
MLSKIAAACAGLMATGVLAAAVPNDDAVRFGMRESVLDVSLSPDGTQIAFISPDAKGQGSTLYVQSLTPNSEATRVTSASGKPERLQSCNWVANTRLACRVYGVTRLEGRFTTWSRMIAVDADGRNAKLLSRRENSYTRGISLGGGASSTGCPIRTGRY